MSEKPSISLDAKQIAALVEGQIGKLATTVRPDYLAALSAAATSETSSRGRAVLEQLLANARIAHDEGLPLCQDTGYVWVCLEAGGSVCVPADVFSGVDAAVARAYSSCGLRMSMLKDALVERSNTGNNTPALCEVVVRKSTEAPTALLHVMLKGGGSDNASSLSMLPPSAGTEGVMAAVVEAVAAKGANACPPLVVGVGVGASFDKVGSLAKHALLRELGTSHPQKEIAALEEELLVRINSLGIGPGGLGGSTTALAVHLESAPCHIAALPVAVNIGCTALRSSSQSLL